MLAFARRRVADDLAADVVAETFLVAWRRLDDVPDDALPWLFGVARKVVGNQRRTQRRSQALLDRLAADRAARAAGCSRATFAVRLHRARRRLAAAMDGEHPPALPLEVTHQA